MKRYKTLIRSGIIVCLRFRMGVLVTFLGNLIYLIIVYSLWKSIYASSGTSVMNGMTFQDTMIYLVLASSMYMLLESHLTWRMHEDIQSGKIVLDIVKPMGYQTFKYAGILGEVLFNFLTTFVPTFLIVYFISGCKIHIGFNVILFLLSMFIGIIISLSVDFFIGTIGLYTQSIWGINIMKEVVIMLFSGAVVPINFFPEPLKTITMRLPFQAIYNTPLQLLINDKMSAMERFGILGNQIMWLVLLLVISNVYWQRSLKTITVNGG